MNDQPRTTVTTVLTTVVVVGLLIDAFVHLHLAPAFAANRTRWLSEPALFRAEAAAAIVAAVALVVRRNRVTTAFAFIVAASGTVAVVVYRYVDLGAIGPIPDMYDPYWAPALKTISVVAEALAALAALALMVTDARRASPQSSSTIRHAHHPANG